MKENTLLKNSRANWPEVAIIILNWNNYEDTARCLSSVEDIDYPHYTVYVVDNSSTDDSLDRLREKYDWCHFVENSQNLGFAGGCNQGIEKALDNGADHILLLNNDAVVKPSFLRPLVNAAEIFHKVALVGGIIEHMKNDDIWYAGSTFNTTLIKSGHQTTVRGSEPYQTEHITGAMMLITNEFLSEHGKLNEEYFFGYEDVEISWRARKNGWKTLVAPNSRIRHEVSSTAGLRSPFKFYHATRNRLKFAQNLEMFKRLVFYVFFVTSRVFRAVQWSTHSPNRIKAIWEGIVDHLLRRPPKKPEEFPQ